MRLYGYSPYNRPSDNAKATDLPNPANKSKSILRNPWDKNFATLERVVFFLR